ncbi:MAG: hydroxymethylbilane synthase [Gammaproteobacteria bacterium]|nr:hydroxymethylbilane synthase [Gammaproteobacteria bacterium]
MTAKTLIRIASRASELALWQSRHVAHSLASTHVGLQVELVPIITAGDRTLEVPLAGIGGKGLFIKELEVALMEDRADIAVHSMKDVPVEIPSGLHIPAILKREDPRDVLLARAGGSLADLPVGACVGTSSLRRKSQLLAARGDLDVRDLRGNVPTRIKKLLDGPFDAIVLAAAGLRRLGLMDDRYCLIDTEVVLPAVGQGAIGVECRMGDAAVEGLIGGLNDETTALCVRAERSMNLRLGGNCNVPVAGYAAIDGSELMLVGLVAEVDGRRVVRHTASGPPHQAERIGAGLGERLLNAGADHILEHLKDTAER